MVLTSVILSDGCRGIPLPVTCVHFATSGAVCNGNQRPAHSDSLKGHRLVWLYSDRKTVNQKGDSDGQDFRFQSWAIRSPFELLIQTVSPTKWSWIDRVWSKINDPGIWAKASYLAVIRRWENNHSVKQIRLLYWRSSLRTLSIFCPVVSR